MKTQGSHKETANTDISMLGADKMLHYVSGIFPKIARQYSVISASKTGESGTTHVIAN